MKTKELYIEQKTDGRVDLNHKGPAEIGEVSFSKSGMTIYYKDKTFRRIKKGGIFGNYYCVETGDEYWISGVKKRGCNRHEFGSGPIIENK